MLYRLSIIFISFITIIIIIASFSLRQAQAALKISSPGIQVSAAVGDFYLNVYGFIAPYASIELTSDGIFYRSTVADEFGFFSFTGILIKKGFDNFCLKAVDFKRIGESTTCFSFPPATGSITMRDLFLPPTLGLYRSTIEAGGELIAFGYSMPGSKVTLHLSDGRTVVVYADQTGYYEAHITNIPAGEYHIYAESEWEGKHSLFPSKVLAFQSLGWWEQFLAWLKALWDKVWKFITALGLGPLWLVIPLLALIIFLVLKLWPEKFTYITESKLLQLLPFAKPRKLLHHWWMKGVGY